MNTTPLLRSFKRAPMSAMAAIALSAFFVAITIFSGAEATRVHVVEDAA